MARPAESLAQAASQAEHAPISVSPPEWAYPVNPPKLPNARAKNLVVRVPHSNRTFPPSQLQDLFNTPDWHPEDHPAMPVVVARGRKPGVYACGYCHLPDGAGIEHRDARARFVAYVPVGSVKAGETLAKTGGPNRTLACASCHGANLKGAGLVLPIAGRSPSYTVRQSFEAQSGLRVGTDVAPVADVVRQLTAEDMISIASYLATLC